MEQIEAKDAFRRIIYTSKAGDADYLAILRQSRTNNGIDGVSGLLSFDGTHYTQVIEGPPESVGATFDRIVLDPRHSDVDVISDTIEPARAFGGWTMAGLPGDYGEIARELLAAMLKDAPAEVRHAFERI